jgi:hypothetical protein
MAQLAGPDRMSGYPGWNEIPNLWKLPVINEFIIQRPGCSSPFAHVDANSPGTASLEGWGFLTMELGCSQSGLISSASWIFAQSPLRCTGPRL